jgi:AraC-like DNA-binding protein
MNQANEVATKRSFIRQYISKGKKERDTLRICQGYHLLSNTYEDATRLVYADSIIELRKESPSQYYPAHAYKLKGDFYKDRNDYKSALDAYLQFSFFAKATQNERLIFNSNYYIAITKRRAGDQKGALNMLRANFSYAKDHQKSIDPITYLRCYTSLVNVFNDMKAIDSVVHYSNYGMQEAIRLNKEEFKYHFALSRGVAHFFVNEYYTAIDSIEKGIPYFEKTQADGNLEFAYFYAGESYRNINNTEKAVAYFKKVDTLFQKNQVLFPSLREAYTRLIQYYGTQKDTLHQFVYLNRRNTIDSISKANNLDLYKEIIEAYEIPQLQAQIDSSNQKLKNQQFISKRNTFILMGCILILLIAFGIQFRKRRIYKKRFQEILDDRPARQASVEKKQSSKVLNVPKDIAQGILAGLETFEQEHDFIANDITLNSLSQKLLTNPNYLSKVVNHYKKTSFSNYINNLRIDYAIEQLKTNPVYKKYTIKAISSEVGFNNVQSFSKAFYNSKGINPSYFIKELKKVG